MKKSLRISILNRDNYTCQYCGRRAPGVSLHVEHIRSRHDGGADHPSNLVASCVDCNLGKGRRSLVIEELEPNVLAEVRPLPDRYWTWLMGAVMEANSRTKVASIRGRKEDRMAEDYAATQEAESYRETFEDLVTDEALGRDLHGDHRP